MILPATLKFLKDLRKHNNKAWFDAHRPAYEAAKLNFQDFIQSVIEKHAKRDKDLLGLEARKCLFRINRDVRFSKDKSPYKVNFGASMDKGGKKSGLAGYYFHLQPGESFVGGGIWMPEAASLKKLRLEIDYCLPEFRKIVESGKFKKTFGTLYTGEGVQLKKLPQGFSAGNPAEKYLKFKSWLALAKLADDELTSSRLVAKTAASFAVIQPLIKFLNRPLEED